MRNLWFALVNGARDTRHVAGRAALSAVHVTFLAIFVGIGSGWVLQSVDDIRATASLATHRAAYFIRPAATEPQGAPTGELRKLLENELRSGRAYATESPRAGIGGNRVLIVYGSMPGLTNANSEAPYALVGNRTGVSTGQQVSYAGESFKVVGPIPVTGYIDLWMEYQRLDDAIVLVADPGKVETIRQERLEGLIGRLVLLDPSPTRISAVVTGAHGFAPVLPRWVKDKIRWDFEPELRGRASFLVVFAAGMLTTVVGALSGLNALIRSRRRDFVVHFAVGADFAHLLVRLSAFVCIAWTLPALLAAGLGLWLVASGTYLAVVWPWLCGAFLLAGLLMSAHVAYRMTRSDILVSMREGTW